jgi:cysteine desulfuration protein SufE
MASENIPPRLAAIVDEFAGASREEKLELLLEYSDAMSALPPEVARNRDRFEQIHECATPVFVHAEAHGGRMRFYFDVPPESPTIRGYASILGQGLDEATPQEVLALPSDFYEAMGLGGVLSPQRLNGISAIVRYVKGLARRELGG